MSNFFEKQREYLALVRECQAATPELRRLWRLNRILGLDVQESHERTQGRILWIKKIARCAENGKVALIEGGRDCDGVQYSGRCHEVDATVQAVEAEIESIQAWSDGPTWFDVMSPSEAEAIHYESRDLVMEAFEDGHPHCLKP